MKRPIGRRGFLFCVGALLASGGFLLYAGAAAQTGDTVRITLLGTTDIHGNIYPIDYYQNRPANRGLAKIATLIKQVRAAEKNVLLLDSGDTIQGTPLAHYFARIETSKRDPTIAVMNALRFDAAAVGNHEFNFGLANLWKAKGEAKFSILAANVEQTYATGVKHFQPYVIRNVGGVRVGIVGMVTPGIPRWEVPANYAGYKFLPIVETAKRILPEIRKKADLLVVIAHTGLGPDPGDAQGTRNEEIRGENAAWALAAACPEIDVILFGHSHQELSGKTVGNVLLVQAKNWGQSLARVDVEMKREGGKWSVAAKKSELLPANDSVAVDAEILKLAAPYHEATQAYLDKAIATSSAELNGNTGRVEDHPFVDLVHAAQMHYGKADVSFATMFLTTARIPAGKVTVRDVASLYIYENTLYTIEMTGAQIAEALEHAAGMFPKWPLAASERLRPITYSADSAEGVSYVMNLSKPEGQRIENLMYKGQPVAPAQKFRVAINNYRYTGGGRYNFNGLPVLYRSPIEMRELLIEYVTERKTIPTTADNNWRIVPEEAARALAADARRPAAASSPAN